MGQAGRKLANGRQLLGPQHFGLALLQAIDDHADLIGQVVEDRIQMLDSRIRGHVDRPDHFFQSPAEGGIGT